MNPIFSYPSATETPRKPLGQEESRRPDLNRGPLHYERGFVLWTPPVPARWIPGGPLGYAVPVQRPTSTSGVNRRELADARTPLVPKEER